MLESDAVIRDDVEGKILDINRSILDSLDSGETLRNEKNLAKDSMAETIKSITALLDNSGLKVTEVEYELKEMHSRVVTHPYTSMEAAFAVGTLDTKVSLLKAENVDVFVGNFRKQVEILSQNNSKSFELICVLSGILNCGGPKAKVILSQNSFMSFLFENILKCCSTTSPHSHQSFVTLKTWSNRLRDLKGDQVVQAKSLLATSCIKMAMANWDNPLRGIPDLVEEVLGNVLDCCKKGNVKDYEDVLNNLWTANMENVSWLSKSKYPPMAVLLPRIGVEKILEGSPDFGENLGLSFSSNHLAAAGVTVYRIILKFISLDTWEKQFLNPLVEALTSDDTIIRTNASNHWMSSTIKGIKGSGDVLIFRLGACQSDHAWAIRCLILKQERLLNSDNLKPEQLEMLHEALVHALPDVRSAAFSVLCHQKKKGEAPCDVEMDMILHFVEQNLTVDSPSFRQEFLSDFTSLMLRIRNFCVANLRKNQAKVDTVIAQLDRLTKSLVASLFPGANYQRLITSLEFLRVMTVCLFDYEPGGINKSCANSDPSALLEYSKTSLAMLDFYTEKNFNCLLTCTLHHMADIRKASGDLLMKFEPGRGSVLEVLQKAFSLAFNPKFGLCESGAILFKLSQYWIKEDSLRDLLKSVKFGDDPDIGLLSQSFMKALSKSDETIVNLPTLFLDMYEELFCQIESNFLQLSRHAPMHGLLTALRACLPVCDVTPVFVHRLIEVMTQSSRQMLLLLSGRRTEDDNDAVVNASFEDMGVAIQSLLKSGEPQDDEDNVDDNVCISDDHSLALACTWLNLKECSLLASTLVVHFGFKITQQAVEALGSIIQLILTRCRQKGALESSSIALAEFATCLLTDSRVKSECRAIPEKMLVSVFDSLESDRNISVTRRSAGFPILIRRIVASEPRSGGQNRKLLSLAILRLLHIIRKIGAVTEAAELEDTSQAHALHILKSLVHEGSLNHDIGFYLADILQASIEKFNSTCWAIRNAALQLFGSIVPRLLGQKKTRSDDSTHNIVLIHEFFSRYSHLKDCLLQNLIHCGNSSLVNPGLVPLLSLLSRISNGGQSFGSNEAQTILEFKTVFATFLSSPVINVRRLAAKAFANFTDRLQLVLEIILLSRQCCEAHNSTNLTHGLLCCIQAGINLLIYERKDEFESSKNVLNENVIQMCDHFKSTECCIIKIQLFQLCKILQLEQGCLVSAGADTSRSFHPGMAEWSLSQNQIQIDLEKLHEDEDFIVASREEALKMVKKLTETSRNIGPYKSIYLTNRFLQSNLDGPNLSGVMIESCNELLSNLSDVIIQEAELALDLLDVPTHEKILAGKYGLAAKTSSLIVASICFSGMLMQPDYKMFFEGGGPYVALFAEHCDTLKELSVSTNLETSRLHVARALIKLLPALNMRKVGTEFDLHLRYAVCQAVNAAFNLLSDEDISVRQLATKFASNLDPNHPNEIEFFNFCSFSSLITSRAVQKLFLFGLNELSECADWLSPIIDLFFTPWNGKDVLDVISPPKTRQILYDTSEGLNVYEEPVAANELYFDTFTRWSQHQLSRSSELSIKLNLNPESCLEIMVKLVDHFNTQSGSFSDLNTPQGYLVARRTLNFSKLLQQFPEILYDKSKYDKTQFEAVVFHLSTITA